MSVDEIQSVPCLYADSFSFSQPIQDHYELAEKCVQEKNMTHALYYFQLAADEGNVLAMFRLASCYAEGNGVAKNMVVAVHWYVLAAERGDVAAARELGKYYYLHTSETQLAYHWLQCAAENDDVEAAWMLGCYFLEKFHLDNVGVDQAAYWLRKAAEQGHPAAMFSLSYLLRKHKNESDASLHWTILAAERGNRMALIELVNRNVFPALDQEDLSSKNDKRLVEAVRFCHEGVTHTDNVWFMRYLSYFYAYGYGVSQDMDAAIYWCLQAVNKADASAQCTLGDWFFEGKALPEDKIRAFHLYTLAANQEYAPAQFKLGKMYAEANGVEQDEVKALQAFNIARKMFRRSMNSIFKTEALAEILRYFREKAAQGNLEAQYYLARCLDGGKDFPKDRAEAIRIYRELAEKGFAKAQYRLGRCYAEGKSVIRNDAEAVRWYQQAADQNFVKAITELAWRYYDGRTFVRDRVAAVTLFQRVSDQGSTSALCGLGYCLLNGGDGVMQDMAQGVHLLRMAVNVPYSMQIGFGSNMRYKSMSQRILKDFDTENPLQPGLGKKALYNATFYGLYLESQFMRPWSVHDGNKPRSIYVRP